ncbi:MAG: SurA N-terminal domain-containing protein [Granulosicoccus sp.]|nr:SurA N-terminal domain-containing protein [Granulosicoccus sp.]
MLLDLREYVRNSKPVKYTLITIICIPFAFVGINSYFSGGGANYAAKVDGEEIGLREFEQAYFQQRQQLQQMFGGEIPAAFNDETRLRQQALDSLLTQQALANTVSNNGFALSDETLAKNIQNIPIFQRDGNFDKDLYRRELQSRSMTVDQFEAGFRDDSAIAQFRSGIVDTAFVLPGEKSRLEELSGQIRKTDYVRFELAAEVENTEVSDEEVQTHFDENADSYNFPERVKIQYLELSRDELKAAVDITDEEAEEYFESNSGNYITGEERKASHILLEVDGDLEEKTAQLLDIKKRIEEGEDFAALAAEFSTDIGSAENGGSLGQFGKGAMVPEFEAAVFALTEPGSLSEPVQSEFGLHLIKLDEAIPERGKTFDEVKAEIVDILKVQAADREYVDLYDILSEQTFDNPESLDLGAEATGLEIKTSDWIDGTDNTDPVLSNPQVLSTALSDTVLQDGNNSDVIELGERFVMVLRVLEHEGPRPKTLDDVREDLITQLKSDKAGEALDSAAAALLEAAKSGAELEPLAEEHGGELFEGQELGRNSAELDRNAVSQLFKLAKPTADKPVFDSAVLDNGDRAVMVLREILSEPTPQVEAAEESTGEDPAETTAEAEPEESTPAEPAGGSYDPRLGNAEFTLLLENLRAKAEVETNPAVLNADDTYPQ